MGSTWRVPQGRNRAVTNAREKKTAARPATYFFSRKKLFYMSRNSAIIISRHDARQPSVHDSGCTRSHNSPTQRVLHSAQDNLGLRCLTSFFLIRNRPTRFTLNVFFEEFALAISALERPRSSSKTRCDAHTRCQQPQSHCVPQKSLNGSTRVRNDSTTTHCDHEVGKSTAETADLEAI